MRHFNR